MKAAVIFTAIEGVGTPHLAVFRAHNPDVPYFVATKPADLHFNHHMDATIVECWAKNREGLDVDYVIHADYDTRIACDIMRALAMSEDRLVDVITNTWTLGGRGATLNLVAFRKSLLDLMVDEYAAFNPDMYCELRVVEFCKAHGLHMQLMPSDVCHELRWECRDVLWWERRFAHPVKHSIDNTSTDVPLKLDDLHANDPYSEFPIADYPTPIIEGWFSDCPIFHKLIAELRPELIIEVGTWLGASAIHMGRGIKQLGLNTRILCVDTWLGSLEFWLDKNDPARYLRLGLKNGYPTVYRQFMANVIHEGLCAHIIPFPQISSIAAQWLTDKKIAADMIYIDGGHGFDAVTADLDAYAKLVRPGGVIFGDDYDQWQSVKHAVDAWCSKHGHALGVDGHKWIIRL